MYPTRAVRHAAWDALDSLFPVSISHCMKIILLITRSNFDKHISSKTSACNVMIHSCLAGRALPEASHQSIFQAAVSVVLAILVLELCGFLH